MILSLTSALRAFTLCVLAALSLALIATAPAAAADAPRATSAIAACPAAAANPSAGNLRSLRRTTLCLLNRERSNHGLRGLRSNRKLTRAAMRYSRDMVQRKFFSHVSPGGSSPTDRIKSSGYLRGARSWAIGENLAWGGGSYATPLRIVRSWMNSPGHRANILSGNYREVGIGMALGAPANAGDAATYTTHFGRRG